MTLVRSLLVANFAGSRGPNFFNSQRSLCRVEPTTVAVFAFASS